MKRNRLKSFDKTQLRLVLGVFFLCLAIPAAVLIQQSYSRLKWETFHQHQLLAEELSGRINNQLIRWINVEEQRPITEYAFLNVAGAPAANFIQRSPLSSYPVQPEIPGLLGYFQVDAAGNLSTPFVPIELDKAKNYGILEPELAARLALQQNIEQILRANRLVSRRRLSEEKADKTLAKKAYGRIDSGYAADTEREEKAASRQSGQAGSSAAGAPLATQQEGQAVFDELKNVFQIRSKQENTLGKLQDLAINKYYNEQPAPVQESSKVKDAPKRAQTAIRKEKAVVAESPASAKPAGLNRAQGNTPFDSAMPAKSNEVRIRTFESEIDPFEFSQLDSGHFVLYRKVWMNGQRYIQGLLLAREGFLQGSVNAVFQQTALSQMSDLLVVLQDNVLYAFSGRSPRGYLSSSRELQGELLYQAQLADPFSDLQLVFSITRLPVGAGGWVIIWLSLVLLVVLLAGVIALYRLGLLQINLVDQQQDFVSAVSHELKTPLTSIRMYSEMLQAGWVDEAKKLSYYDFILDESERLTRLINNVLQLAKLTRNNQQPELKTLTIGELMDGIRSKTANQIERAGFELNLSWPEEISNITIKVNPDWFIQIFINLVDNALKFSIKADIKRIEISCRRLRKGRIQFTVRDFGPGIAKDQMKKIFKLFYRTENELTRETVGTGIGLALASQMLSGMDGRIDVVNANPGAEFRFDLSIK